MSGSNTNDRSRESERTLDPKRLPGDELYMMTGGVYVLCSVRRPSTQWIAADAVDDLSERR
jgi:hypothetical protein